MLTFRGQAHGPTGSYSEPHVQAADLNSAQLNTTSLTNLPLYVEHETDVDPCGVVLGSWVNSDGALRVSAVVYDDEVAGKILDGELLGLSLGTSTSFLKGDDRPFLKVQEELSLVRQPARAGCYIDALSKTFKAHKKTSSKKNSRSLSVTPFYTGVKVNLRQGV